METKDYRILFLEKSLLGRKTKLEKPDEVIHKCIRLAYKDMLTVGRFYLINDKENNIDSRCNYFRTILEKNNYVYSRVLIDETLTLFNEKEEMIKNKDGKYVTRYGLAQKFVNMTYKYFYVFHSNIKKDIDFSHCDCPLDSVILEEKLNYKDCKWSRLTKEKYESIQQLINDNLQSQPQKLNCELKSLGNLAFDFLYW